MGIYFCNVSSTRVHEEEKSYAKNVAKVDPNSVSKEMGFLKKVYLFYGELSRGIPKYGWEDSNNKWNKELPGGNCAERKFHEYSINNKKHKVKTIRKLKKHYDWNM